MDDLIKNVIGKNTGKIAEDEYFEKELLNEDCPYGICNGSGVIPSTEDSREAEFCDCREDKVMLQKLKNSNINQNFLDKTFDSFDSETIAYLFKPKKNPGALEKNTRVKSEIDETTNNYIKRKYTKKKEKRSLKELLTSFSSKNVELLNKNVKTANLLLFGDPGNGKTTFATLVGLEFLKANKKVYFTTTQDFLDAIFDKEINPKELARSVDVLILDELFNEYHTDSQFAKKQLKEIFKIREELGLITICTSNGTPKDFSLLYGESMMSMINGNFFLFYLERDTDARVENMHHLYDEFGL